MKLKGYMGKVLHIDLTHSKGHVEDLREEWAHQFIGGSGLGTKFLYVVNIVNIAGGLKKRFPLQKD
jgi:aldehyde:ferredoxin oxidoreductase